MNLNTISLADVRSFTLFIMNRGPGKMIFAVLEL